MKILLVCSSGTSYVLQIWKYMKKYYPEIKYSLLTNDTNIKYYQDNIELDDGEGIYYYHFDKMYIDLRHTIKKLPSFDIIHFLWIERQMGLLINELKKKTRFIYTSVGGSDLYRDSKKLHVRMWQKKLLRKSDWFSSENEATRDHFYSVYGEELISTPHSIVNFGVDIIDELDNISQLNVSTLKEKYDIPKDKIVVTLGYNGRREQQHLEMINSFRCIDENILESFFFIIPMTYLVPNEEYVDEVEKELQKYTRQYKILRKYMTTTEMAESVLISDIMIHVQTTDQLSSTMIAHMYNGNIVIAGGWLPYSNLINNGIVFYQIDNIDEIAGLLIKFCKKIHDEKDILKKNRELVYKLSSWEVSAKKWYNIYNNLYD